MLLVVLMAYLMERIMVVVWVLKSAGKLERYLAEQMVAWKDVWKVGMMVRLLAEWWAVHLVD